MKRFLFLIALSSVLAAFLYAAPAPDKYYPATGSDPKAATAASEADAPAAPEASAETSAASSTLPPPAPSGATVDPVIPFLRPVPKDVRNNEYYMESLRLTDLAQASYDEGNYDTSTNYAVQAAEQARLSDEYAALLLRIKHANDSLTSARGRLDWAEGVNATARYPEPYAQATSLWDSASAKYEAQDWEGAASDADSAFALLASFQEAPRLPGQFTVRAWETTRDCLWNIAAKDWAYKDPFKWTVIYEANKDVLPRANEPDLVTPGLVLTLPSIKGEIREGMWIDGVDYPEFED